MSPYPPKYRSTPGMAAANHLPMESIDLAGDYRAMWGEGPIWWQNHLYYVDIEGHTLVEFDPTSNRELTWDVSSSVGRIGTVVPRTIAGPEGSLLVAGDTGIHFFNTQTGICTPIADPESDQPDNRFNDGKCSPDGRLFAGTISLTKKKGSASLYRLDPDLSLHTAFGGVTNSNGIVWSRDASTCYYIDTPRREVLAMDYSPATGELSHVRTAFSTGHIDASPDGMAIDEDDKLWIAFCHGACVICYDPTSGKQLHRIELPCLETTACCFGGENLAELYITTGMHKNIKEENAGRLFCVKGLGVAGVPTHPFQG